MSDNLVTQADLAEWAGFRPNQKVAIIRWLKDNKIPYFYGKGGTVCTTQHALDSRLVGSQNGQPEKEQVEFV